MAYINLMLSSTLLDFPTCPAFLAGKTPASMTFPEFQGADQLLIKGAPATKLPGARFKRPGKLIKIRRLTTQDSVLCIQYSSHVQLFGTLRTASHQASLSITVSQSLPKFMSIESVMPSSHLILSPSSPSVFSLSQHQGLFHSCSSEDRTEGLLR